MGKIIVIDGLDASGKATQADRLFNKLQNMGKEVYKVDFPNYTSGSSKAVRMYLHGDLGKDPSKLNPYICSLFYTVDRGIQFIQNLNTIYNKPDSILICDRYISANVIHQGAKIDIEDQKRKYFDWVYDLEVNKVGLPKEDITIVLSLPVEVSQNLLNKRYDNHSEKKDIHESDIDYLHKCYNTLQCAVDHFSDKGYNWVKIDCEDGSGGIKTVEEIEALIFDQVKGILN